MWGFVLKYGKTPLSARWCEHSRADKGGVLRVRDTSPGPAQEGKRSLLKGGNTIEMHLERLCWPGKKGRKRTSDPSKVALVPLRLSIRRWCCQDPLLNFLGGHDLHSASSHHRLRLPPWNLGGHLAHPAGRKCGWWWWWCWWWITTHPQNPLPMALGNWCLNSQFTNLFGDLILLWKGKLLPSGILLELWKSCRLAYNAPGSPPCSFPLCCNRTHPKYNDQN